MTPNAEASFKEEARDFYEKFTQVQQFASFHVWADEIFKDPRSHDKIWKWIKEALIRAHAQGREEGLEEAEKIARDFKEHFREDTNSGIAGMTACIGIAEQIYSLKGRK